MDNTDTWLDLTVYAILAVFVLWTILWFLIPFMLWDIAGNIRRIYREVQRQGGHAPEPVAPVTHGYRVAGFRNGKFKRVNIKAADENEASEKAMSAGIEVQTVSRA